MQKLFITVAIIATISLSAYNYSHNQKQSTMSDLTLQNVEAMAGCETSSSHGNNVGYCTSMIGGSGDACVSSGSGSEPRCSGNY